MMKIKADRPIKLLLIFPVALFAVMGFAQPPQDGQETDPNGDIVVTSTVKLKQSAENLEQKLEKTKQEEAAAVQSLKNADEESRPRLEQTITAAQNYEKLLTPAIKQVRQIAKDIDTGNKTPKEKQELLLQANLIVTTAYMTHASLQLHTEFLDELKARAEIGTHIPVNDIKIAPIYSGAAKVFSEDEMGGGVFLDEPARLPIDAHSVTGAEYDPALGRFVLHQNGTSLFLPRTDPSHTATVIHCLYNPEPRNKIAVSEDIDPINKGDLTNTAPFGSDQVMFGCQNLWNSDAGRILIDSDDLLAHIWMGKNRRGDDLTRIYKFHSAAQLTLDLAPPGKEQDGKPVWTRYWIRPKSISAHLVGNELVFTPIPFELFTSTIQLPSPRAFRGVAYSNPGADVFSAFFNLNFERFAHLVLREDEETGREIKPFEELRDLAMIAGIVSWIRDSGIPMNTAWASDYPVARALTRHNLPRLYPHIVESEIVPPIVIYNQYGPSRIIDKSGRMVRYDYDSAGNFMKLVRVVRQSDGSLVELPGTLVSGND
ncbi:MAG: hypothetical protein ACLPXT_11690 [Terracidiphilus sp.]